MDEFSRMKVGFCFAGTHLAVTAKPSWPVAPRFLSFHVTNNPFKLAAISPADFEETLSTLRFADRVKQIKTRPVVNETQTEKLVRALREENGRLLEVLHRGGLDGVATQVE